MHRILFWDPGRPEGGWTVKEILVEVPDLPDSEGAAYTACFVSLRLKLIVTL